MKNLKLLRKYAGLLVLVPAFFIINLNFHSDTFNPVKISQPVFDTDKFSITIPVGWTHHAQVSNGFKIFFLNAPPADGFGPNINILNEDTHGASNQEYYDASKENLKKANFDVQHEGDFQANGVKGRYLSSMLDYSGRKLNIKTYLFVKNNLAFVVSATCLATQSATYTPIFDKTVQTLKLK